MSLELSKGASTVAPCPVPQSSLTFKSVGESDYGHLCNQNPLSLLPSESSVKPAGVMVSPIHLRHTAAAIVTLPV